MKRAKAQCWQRFAAFVAVLVVLLQASLIPPARAEIMEVCTAHGIEKILVQGEPGPVMPGDCGHCGHCVLVTPADVPRTLSAAPVRYVAQVAIAQTRADVATLGARAPPRPPGQGPPSP